jgi:hypothetical protein
MVDKRKKPTNKRLNVSVEVCISPFLKGVNVCSAGNSRDRDPLLLKLGIANLEYVFLPYAASHRTG